MRKKNGNGGGGVPAKVEDSVLGISESGGGELSRTADAAEVLAEIQGAMTLAHRFPRKEEDTYHRLMKACKRTGFAVEAMYSYPRGGTTVSGPSVNLAREFARMWGRIQYGMLVVYDDEDQRKIRAYAWDLESNARVVLEDSFQKLIQRKDKKTGETFWVKPDERDLRELTNRRGAILERNCILKLMPRDYIEDALREIKSTVANRVAQDPDAQVKAVILAFGSLRVSPRMLEEYLGVPVSEAQPEQVAELRAIYQSIADGNSTWAEYLKPTEEEPDKEPEKEDDLSDLAEVVEDEDEKDLDKPANRGKRTSKPKPDGSLQGDLKLDGDDTTTATKGGKKR